MAAIAFNLEGSFKMRKKKITSMGCLHLYINKIKIYNEVIMRYYYKMNNDTPYYRLSRLHMSSEHKK